MVENSTRHSVVFHGHRNITSAKTESADIKFSFLLHHEHRVAQCVMQRVVQCVFVCVASESGERHFQAAAKEGEGN